MKAQMESERLALMQERRELETQQEIRSGDLLTEKEKLHKFRDELHEQETRFLLEREEYEKVKLRESSEMEIQKVMNMDHFAFAYETE